jgi:hypothetical protein
LQEVTHEEHLDAAEWHVNVTIDTQRTIDRVQQIGPNHRYLVDHNPLKTLKGALQAWQRFDSIRGRQSRPDLKERVDSLSTSVQCRNATWGKNNLTLTSRSAAKIVNQPRFARTRATDHHHGALALINCFEDIAYAGRVLILGIAMKSRLAVQ